MSTGHCKHNITRCVSAVFALLLSAAFALELTFRLIDPTIRQPDHELYWLVSEYCNTQSPCEFRLTEVTGFAWEKAAFINYTCDHSRTSKLLGLATHKFPVLSDAAFVIVQNGDPVLIDRILVDADILGNIVWMDSRSTAPCSVFSPDNDLFIGTHETHNGHSIWRLTHVDRSDVPVQ
jgi:hypothetical protein